MSTMIEQPNRGNSDSSLALVQRAQAGDQLALERLLSRYMPRLRPLARKWMGSSKRTMLESQDVVQEALIKVVRRLKTLTFETEEAFEKYVRTAVKRLVIDMDRARRRRPRREELTEIPAPPSTLENDVFKREMRQRYRRALAHMRPAEQKALELWLEDLSYAEIAALTGKQKSDAARIAVARAIKQLASIMAVRRPPAASGATQPPRRSAAVKKRRARPSAVNAA